LISASEAVWNGRLPSAIYVGSMLRKVPWILADSLFQVN
jgi:hypothetical protein